MLQRLHFVCNVAIYRPLKWL